jgi:hypothetical protein
MDVTGSQKCCTHCGKVKDVREFSFKNEARGWRHGFCETCHKAWNRRHYEQNRAKYIATARRKQSGSTKPEICAA